MMSNKLHFTIKTIRESQKTPKENDNHQYCTITIQNETKTTEEEGRYHIEEKSD